MVFCAVLNCGVHLAHRDFEVSSIGFLRRSDWGFRIRSHHRVPTRHLARARLILILVLAEDEVSLLVVEGGALPRLIADVEALHWLRAVRQLFLD